MTDSITERVAQGAALLDAERPGWHERIDLDRLDLGSPCCCILGQEFAAIDSDGYTGRPFTAAADSLFGTEATADDIAEYGFDQYSDECGAYAALTTEWRRLILARRAGSTR